MTLVPSPATPLEHFGVAELRATMAVFRDSLHAHAERLNALNVYPVPDGDTGTNMARTLDAVMAEVDAAPAELAATCPAVSHGSLMGARGNSGVILSQILRGLSATLEVHGDDASAAVVADALVAASTGADRAVLEPVEGTILTVVRESSVAARAAADTGSSLAATLDAARGAGRDALAKTPELLPALRAAGVVDAGGAGFLLLLDAALHVVAGAPLEPAPATVAASPAEHARAALPEEHAAADGPRYEVMFFCDLADDRIETLKRAWGAIGDSVVVVGGDGFWNCHVHSDDIGAAIEAALDLDGRPRDIRVTDLYEQVAAQRSDSQHTDVVAPPPIVCTAVVAVSSGDGISELFRQLGVASVVRGGQTLNPSTAELLEAVEQVRAEEVVVLPNNGNIVPVAEQLAGLSAKKVVVVPTRSMTEGLGALVVYDPEADAGTNGDDMAAAAAGIVTGELTRAVRASTSPVGPIAEGDLIGIERGGGIVAVGREPADVATTLLARLVGDDSELVTVLLGDDAEQATTDAIESWLGEHHPDVAVELHDGGQPLYPYLFGVE